MKKYLSLLLLMAASIFIFVGCGKSSIKLSEEKLIFDEYTITPHSITN